MPCIWCVSYQQSCTSIHDVQQLLIDFRDLVDEHSGENTGPAVFETMELFGVNGCVRLLSSGLIAK